MKKFIGFDESAFMVLSQVALSFLLLLFTFHTLMATTYNSNAAGEWTTGTTWQGGTPRR